MTKTCKICGKEFDGYKSSLYCRECKSQSLINRKENKLANTSEKQFKPRDYKKVASKNNTSGYRGVYFDKSKGKWRAQIRFDNHCYKF